RTVIAASTAAVVGVVSGYPFDSIKTRLQTQHYDSIAACIKQTYKEEGFRGFFRGVIPPLITVSIIKSISFSVYENSKAYYKKHYPILFDRDTMLSTMAISTFAGGISGAFIATLSCPFELVKVQKQLEYLLLQTSSISTGATPVEEKKFTSTSSWHSAREILKKKARDTIGTSVYFGGYETTKYILNGNRDASSAGPLTQFLAGGICGIMCWIVVFPLDLVKTLIQKEILLPTLKYKSAKDCIHDIYSRNGLGGFYKGITVTLIRAFPIHSLNFLVYEQTLLLVKKFHHDGA
ncbi:mitochondrial carrier domain-containing protein, partial [Gilbertella persicaria]|uniref:mitochondrial carrier domain-containing protein n=1 Tax=Gilbertella persicaria TaxID=101096 RepID=UPI002220ADBC